MANILRSTDTDGLNRDCFKTPSRLKLGKNRKRLRYCKRHSKVEPVESRCFREAPRGKAPADGTYRPWLNSILGDNGGVMVQSKRHHRELCRAAGVACTE